MKREDIKKFLRDHYSFDASNNKNQGRIKLKNGEEAFVNIGSIGINNQNPNRPIFIIGSQPDFKINLNDNNFGQTPYFILCGDPSTADYLKNAIGQDDYIISIEPKINPCKAGSTYSFKFEKLINQIVKNYEIGIYRECFINKPETSLNLVLIRVSENGDQTQKYLDAYFASSDSRTYHDVSYPIAQITKKDKIEPKEGVTLFPVNTLVFGAPGTGKSYMLNQRVKDLGMVDTCKRVTFYEDYSYEKFVGGYLPVAKEEKEGKISGQVSVEGSNSIFVNLTSLEDGVSYEFCQGPFLEMIKEAWKDLICVQGYNYSAAANSRSLKLSKAISENQNAVKNATKYVLIIEEINRANAASVFGDMFQLLDRDSDGLSEYGIALNREMEKWFKGSVTLPGNNDAEVERNFEKTMEMLCNDFRLPPNLYIWATMNSADQGVYPLDSAFKRRWSFIYKSVSDRKNGATGYEFESYLKNDDSEPVKIDWDKLRNAINEKMSQDGNIEEDRFLGAHFFKGKTGEGEFAQITMYTQLVEKIKSGENSVGDLEDMPNPLCDKLYAYLRQDVYRNNPDDIFKKDNNSLYKIRKNIQEKAGKLGILDVLSLDIKDFVKDMDSNSTGAEERDE